MINNLLQKKKGFTLIELIIAVSMFALIVILAGSLFLSGFNGYIENSELIVGQSGVRMAMFEISNKLRLADPSSVSVEDGGKKIVIGDTAYSFSKHTGDEYGIITKTENSNSKLLASNIKHFEASFQSDGSIITFKAESKWSGSYVETNIRLGSIPTPTPTP